MSELGNNEPLLVVSQSISAIGEVKIEFNKEIIDLDFESLSTDGVIGIEIIAAQEPEDERNMLISKTEFLASETK